MSHKQGSEEFMDFFPDNYDEVGNYKIEVTVANNEYANLEVYILSDHATDELVIFVSSTAMR